MSEETASITIAQMAQQLTYARKANGLKTVLVLGARAGGLFRSPLFHQALNTFISNEPSTSTDRFTRYYHLLGHNATSPFSSNELWALSEEALSHVTPREADKQLAALILQGYFDPIITTNADTLLEQALTSAGWRDSHEFQVINLLAEPDAPPFSLRRRAVPTIIKVFGELRMRNYLFSERYAYMNKYQLKSNFLKEILHLDCLLVGIDDIWDAALFQAFPAQGNNCWIVLGEDLDKHSSFYLLTETRKTRFFVDSVYGHYEYFIGALDSALIDLSPTAFSTRGPSSYQRERVSQTLQTTDKPVEQLLQNRTIPFKVFISYHQKDEVYLKKLINHLTTLKREGLISNWFKRNILAGQAPANEIQRHLNNASLILLLISDDYLAADDIYTNEIQQAIAQHRQGKAYTLPILIRPVDWQNTSFGDLEPLPSNRRFVTQWNNTDSAFLDIVQGLRKRISYELKRDRSGENEV